MNYFDKIKSKWSYDIYKYKDVNIDLIKYYY